MKFNEENFKRLEFALARIEEQITELIDVKLKIIHPERDLAIMETALQIKIECEKLK